MSSWCRCRLPCNICSTVIVYIYTELWHGPVVLATKYLNWHLLHFMYCILFSVYLVTKLCLARLFLHSGPTKAAQAWTTDGPSFSWRNTNILKGKWSFKKKKEEEETWDHNRNACLQCGEEQSWSKPLKMTLKFSILINLKYKWSTPAYLPKQAYLRMIWNEHDAGFDAFVCTWFRGRLVGHVTLWLVMFVSSSFCYWSEIEEDKKQTVTELWSYAEQARLVPAALLSKQRVKWLVFFIWAEIIGKC